MLEKNKQINLISRKIVQFPDLIANMFRTLSFYNIKAYFYPVNPPDFPGYITEFNRKGISGIAFGVNKNNPLKVELLIDGKVINTTYASQKILFPTKYRGQFIGFYFPLKRIWQYISKDQKIEIRTEGDKLLRMHSGKGVGKALPKKYMSLVVEKNIIELIDEGRVINKFGRIQAHRDKSEGWLGKVSTSYTIINDLFEEKTGKSLFIFYGTMLGYARDGGVMAHDCDLDLAYFSEKTTPEDVRAEFFEITKKLINKGEKITPFIYKLLFNKRSLSVTPCWISDGVFSSTFGYVGDGYIVEKDDILPLKKVDFYGNELYLPNNPVNVAKYIYGRGWKYPDPGWKWLPEYKNYPQILEGRLTSLQVKTLEKMIDNEN